MKEASACLPMDGRQGLAAACHTDGLRHGPRCGADARPIDGGRRPLGLQSPGQSAAAGAAAAVVRESLECCVWRRAAQGQEGEGRAHTSLQQVLHCTVLGLLNVQYNSQQQQQLISTRGEGVAGLGGQTAWR